MPRRSQRGRIATSRAGPAKVRSCLRCWRYALSAVVLASSLPVAAQPATASTEQEQIHTVQPKQLQRRLRIGGTVVTKSDVTLTAQLAGRITELGGAEGDPFRKGQLLARLSDTDLLAKRQAAEARLAGAAAALNNAGVQYQRQLVDPRIHETPGGMGLPSMFDKLFIDPMSSMMGLSHPGARYSADLYRQGAGVAEARAAYDRAFSEIGQIDAKLRDARSIAPFDGFIARKYVEVGDTVQPGDKLIDFAAPQGLQVAVQLPISLTRGLHAGDRLHGGIETADGTQQEVELNLAKIYPTADRLSHTVTVKLDLPADMSARAGMYAAIEIPTLGKSIQKGLAIPRSAVLHEGGLDTVYVVDASHRVRVRLLRLGATLGDDTVQVLAGLEAGERILIHPRPGIRSGDRLRSLSDATNAAGTPR